MAYEKLTTIQLPKIPEWRAAAELGYEPKTTFWQDFCIAEMFGGISGVHDTFQRAFKEWHSDVEYTAELALVLNHRGWWWYNSREHFADKGDDEKRAKCDAYTQTYFAIWEAIDTWAKENYKGEDAEYYFKVTD